MFFKAPIVSHDLAYGTCWTWLAALAVRSAWGPAVARPARLSPAASVRQRRQVVRRVERDHALQDAVAQGVAAAEPPVLVQAGGEEVGLDRAHRVEPALEERERRVEELQQPQQRAAEEPVPKDRRHRRAEHSQRDVCVAVRGDRDHAVELAAANQPDVVGRAAAARVHELAHVRSGAVRLGCAADARADEQRRGGCEGEQHRIQHVAVGLAAERHDVHAELTVEQVDEPGDVRRLGAEDLDKVVPRRERGVDGDHAGRVDGAAERDEGRGEEGGGGADEDAARAGGVDLRDDLLFQPQVLWHRLLHIDGAGAALLDRKDVPDACRSRLARDATRAKTHPRLAGRRGKELGLVLVPHHAHHIKATRRKQRGP
mmetsp:Transcript_23017/g.75755  ORF Transcript_23017/g.75755 Transcript_23017/m.75755 type:complete len:372 (-) Transcript_23017:140-1255(-)